MNRYSWEEPEKKSFYSKNFYSFRTWFFLAISLALIAILTLSIGYGYLYYRFANQVNGFDLSRLEKMESASVIYDRNGVQIGKIFIQNRHPISFAEIPQNMVRAIIAEEDNRFFEHHGVDYFGVLRAAISNYRQGRIKQGASTVTQQLARNSFELKERSFQRKIVEMFLAHRIEENFSKDKIMELYLNRVYFGSGFYGVEAAAMGYFGKPAKDLSVGDCAMLAGLLKSPNGLSPWNNEGGATKVRNFVLTRMEEMHFLTSQELKKALDTPLGVRKRTNSTKVSYAIDLVRQQAIAALGFERAMNGGVRIDTTFDSKLQQIAESSLRQELEKEERIKGYHHETYATYHERNNRLEEAAARGENVNFPTPAYLQGAVLAIDNQTGGILVLVGGRDFTHSEYNRALQGRRPPGTLFTPFVAAAAYEKGIFPGELVDDSAIDNHYVMIGGETGILGEWGVERADNSYEGLMTSHEAVARGKNAAVVRLGFKTGLDSLKQLTAKAGIHAPLREVANVYLGASEMELDDLTLAFSIFPGEGSRPERLYTISKITDTDGTLLFEKRPQRVEVLSPEVAFQTHNILNDALHKTNAQELISYGLKTFPSGGKSGTAYDFTDAWFVGYTSSITCGVWIGFDKPQKIMRGAFGKDLALPVWSSVMNASVESFVAKPIVPPPTLHTVEISQTTGLLSNEKSTTEYATDEQFASLKTFTDGGSTHADSKDLEEAGWPRAATAVDLSLIAPIAITAPAVVTSTSKTQPEIISTPVAFSEKAIPIARAIPVEQTANQDAAGTNTGIINVPEKATKNEKEVRRAEAIRPMDLPTGAPVLTVPTPAAVHW